MRATIQRLATQSAQATQTAQKGSTWGWNNRVNRVPYYQRLFQNPALHTRQWERTARGKNIIMPIYNVMMWGSFAGTMYMMIRMVLGKKTWY